MHRDELDPVRRGEIVPAAMLLAPDLVARASTEFTAAFLPVPVVDVRALRQLVGAVPSGIILLGPEALAQSAGLLEQLSTAEPGWLPMVYTSVTAARVRLFLTSACEWPLPVILSGTVRKVKGSQWLWDTGQAVSQSLRLLPFLAPRLLQVDPLLAVHVVAIFASQTYATTMKELAARCGHRERVISRSLKQAGCPCVHELIWAGPVLRSWEDVSHRDRPLVQIARDHQLRTVRSLRRHWAAVTRFELDAVIGMSLSDAILRSIAERLFAERRSGAI